jgi:hypothetical protein
MSNKTRSAETIYNNRFERETKKKEKLFKNKKKINKLNKS